MTNLFADHPELPNPMGALGFIDITFDPNKLPTDVPPSPVSGRNDDGKLEHSIGYGRHHHSYKCPYISICDHNVGTDYSLEEAKELRRDLDDAIAKFEADIANPPPPPEPPEPRDPSLPPLPVVKYRIPYW